MDRIEPDNAVELRRKLGKRLGLAAVLIVVLLGALAVFDHLSQMEREDTARPGVAPVQPRLGPSITTGRPPPEPAGPAEEPITPSPTLAPKETPLVEPPPKPEISAQPTVTPPAPIAPVPAAPVPAQAPLATPALAVPPKPAPAAPAAPVASAPLLKPTPMAPAPPLASPIRPIKPVAPGAPAPSVPAAVAPIAEESSSTPMLGAAPPPVPPSSPAGATPAAKPALARLLNGFVLQAGVFTSTDRAEELKARLLMAGVPVTIETRVQVGPFATQKEADAARKKIRDLGIDSILIPPRAGRR